MSDDELRCKLVRLIDLLINFYRPSSQDLSSGQLGVKDLWNPPRLPLHFKGLLMEGAKEGLGGEQVGCRKGLIRLYRPPYLYFWAF